MQATANSFKSTGSNTTRGKQMPANSKNSDVIALLKRIGLNEYQAKAYHALHGTNPCTAGELATRAQLPRPRVYDVLTSLQEQGFVAVQQGRPVRYSALALDEAIQTLRKQKEAGMQKELEHVQRISDEIKTKLSTKPAAQEDTRGSESVWTLKGEEAIHSKLATMLQEAKNHVVINSTATGMAQKLKLHSPLLQAARSRGVKLHFVTPQKGTPEATTLAHTSLQANIPSRLVVADDQTLLFLNSENKSQDDETALWLKNPHFAQTMKQLVTGKQ